MHFCVTLLILKLSLLGGALFAAEPGAANWQHVEIRRFPAAEAKQGVAADDQFFYAIDNFAIGKYRKDTGEKVAVWQGSKEGRIKHLNAGVVIGGKLYCAHSNYPANPPSSSIEVWDTQTLQPIESKELPAAEGSLTWVDQKAGTWFACFAHYRSSSDPALSRVTQFDDKNLPLQRWRFPSELVQRFGAYSASGGQFGPEGHLFVTGHDARELYVLSMKPESPELQWLATIPISAAGQAFCFDPTAPEHLYSTQRKTREVILSRIFQNAVSTQPKP